MTERKSEEKKYNIPYFDGEKKSHTTTGKKEEY